MSGTAWNEVAAGLARHVRKNALPMRRGALFMTCAGDQRSAAILFGNDNYAGSDQSRLAVALIRHRISETDMEEAGFGLSPDGYTWVLLIRAHPDHDCSTVAGKAFQLEMWKTALQDLILEAWHRAGAVVARPSSFG